MALRGYFQHEEVGNLQILSPKIKNWLIIAWDIYSRPFIFFLTYYFLGVKNESLLGGS